MKANDNTGIPVARPIDIEALKAAREAAANVEIAAKSKAEEERLRKQIAEKTELEAAKNAAESALEAERQKITQLDAEISGLKTANVEKVAELEAKVAQLEADLAKKGSDFIQIKKILEEVYNGLRVIFTNYILNGYIKKDYELFKTRTNTPLLLSYTKNSILNFTKLKDTDTSIYKLMGNVSRDDRQLLLSVAEKMEDNQTLGDYITKLLNSLKEKTGINGGAISRRNKKQKKRRTKRKVLKK